jgi:molybdopterin molybdotransferase
MIKYPEALEILLSSAPKSTSSLLVPLEQAVGRVAARTVVSDQLVPRFPNSAMDGFAVISEQTLQASRSQPLHLEVVGSIVAGDPAIMHPSPIGAWEIMTGAPVPVGYDAIVKVEDVQVLKDSAGNVKAITLYAPLQEGENYRDAGEDFQVGDPILEAGTLLAPEHILALASFGHAEVHVQKKPRVALISTGKELVTVGGALETGQIWNSTAPFLMTALAELGAEPVYYGIAADQPEEFLKVLKCVLDEKPDLVLTTGAVSVGKHDFVAEALRQSGVQILFSKVAIRPGKPILFGTLKANEETKLGPVFFGLPGNPVSTAIGLRFFVEPFIRKLLGRPREVPMRARLMNECSKPVGLRAFYKAKMDWTGETPRAVILPGQSSFMVSPLLKANVWAVLPEASSKQEPGTWVDLYCLL